jgi:hypothetical protein
MRAARLGGSVWDQVEHFVLAAIDNAREYRG